MGRGLAMKKHGSFPLRGFIGIHILLTGNLGLAGNLCLAESTAISVEAVLCGDIILGHREKMFTAGGLVLTRLGDGTYWTSLDTYPANALRKKEAILLVFLQV